MAKKKSLDKPLDVKRAMIEPFSTLSIPRQCELLGISRSGYYYHPVPESEENLRLMRLMDEQYLATPFYGYRRMWAWLRQQGHEANLKRIHRLYRLMGIAAIYCKPDLSKPNPEHKIYPYLLRNVPIVKPNQVWSTDITYVPMKHGFLYLVAVIDWYSRYVLSWELSNSLDTGFCLSALERAFTFGRPEVFNTDQGSQFTSLAFTGYLLEREVSISMDGKGRALDNIFIERLWRDVKHQHIYLHDYQDGNALHQGLTGYFKLHNDQKPHQSLDYKTPAEVYFDKKQASKESEIQKLNMCKQAF
jgi:putative transposase